MKKTLQQLKYFGFGFLVWWIGQESLAIPVAGQTLPYQLIGLLLSLLAIAASIYASYRLGLLKKGQSLLAKGGWKTILLGFLALFLTNIATGIVNQLLNGLEATTQNQENLANLAIPFYLLTIFTTILAPVVEEFVFRGLVMGKIFGRHSILGLAVSSLLFAAIHVPTNLGSWIVYGGMGLVFGLIYRKTNRLDYCMAVHFLNNGLATLVMLLASQV